MFNNALRKKLDAGEVAFGTFFKFADPSLVEIIGHSGFDFIIVDCEHASFTDAEVENMIRASELTGMSTMVRTRDAGQATLLHALDSGASGVQVPSLNTPEEVAGVVRYSKYVPVGERGWARGCRAADYAFDTDEDYGTRANRDTIISVHIETKAMLDHIDALCAIEALDVLFIGTGDLSQSMGHPNNPKAPEVQAAFDMVTAKAVKAGKHVGAVASNAEDIERFVAAGHRYIVWQSDMTMFKGALRGAVSKFAPYR
jgi:4-hydroxy-2-oxoheptanedioate aldolase